VLKKKGLVQTGNAGLHTLTSPYRKRSVIKRCGTLSGIFAVKWDHDQPGNLGLVIYDTIHPGYNSFAVLILGIQMKYFTPAHSFSASATGRIQVKNHWRALACGKVIHHRLSACFQPGLP
jgi:hypothetical protein